MTKLERELIAATMAWRKAWSLWKPGNMSAYTDYEKQGIALRKACAAYAKAQKKAKK